MIKKIIKNFIRSLGWRLEKIRQNEHYNLSEPPDNIIQSLKKCKGIIHVGAHRSEEAPIYEWFGKKVIWVEANPIIFNDLQDQIHKYKHQKVYKELLTDKTNQKLDFYLSNNDYASSSIFKFGKLSVGNESLWPNKNLKMIDKIKLNTCRFDDFIEKNKIDIQKFDHWIVDVQGAEFSFLKGAEKNIKFCNSLLIEVSNGEIYEGGSHWADVKKFLEKNSLKPQSQPESNHSDILFLR